MSTFQFHAKSEADTDRLGRLLADVLVPNQVVALIGTLGAGKTRLVQAVAAGLGVDPETVTSPTFVLITEYTTGRLPVYHTDMYRVRDEDELAELGLEEYFTAGGVTFVEWADRFADCLPTDRLTIEITSVGDKEREFCVGASGAISTVVLEGLKKSW